jgi:hypothetical protein
MSELACNRTHQTGVLTSPEINEFGLRFREHVEHPDIVTTQAMNL